MNWDITDKRGAETARREREIALRENQAKSKFLASLEPKLAEYRANPSYSPMPTLEANLYKCTSNIRQT